MGATRYSHLNEPEHERNAIALARQQGMGLRAISRALGRRRESWPYGRGSKVAKLQKPSRNTGMQVYFCDPHSPWQRGSNENANGLLQPCEVYAGYPAHLNLQPDCVH